MRRFRQGATKNERSFLTILNDTALMVMEQVVRRTVRRVGVETEECVECGDIRERVAKAETPLTAATASH